MDLFNSKVHVWVEFTARNLLWMKAFPNHCSLKRLTKDTTGTFTNYSYWISTLLYFRCLIRTHGLFLTTILERATTLPWCHCEDQLSEHTQGFKPLARSCMWAIHSSAALRLVAPLCLTLCDPTLCSLPGSSVPGDSPGKNGCHALLQRIFQTQGLNPGLPHCGQILYCLSYQGHPKILYDWPVKSSTYFVCTYH